MSLNINPIWYKSKGNPYARFKARYSQRSNEVTYWRSALIALLPCIIPAIPNSRDITHLTIIIS
jgi:hypothetical protein